MLNGSRRRLPGATISSLLGLLLLAGCGGGGGSSSGGGGGTTSTMIIQVASVNGRVASYAPQGQVQGADKLLVALRDLVMQNAWAATAGVEIYVDGALVGVTDGSGQLVFPISAGTHQICLKDPVTLGEACINDFFVEENKIVTLSNVTVNNGVVTSDAPVVSDDPSHESETEHENEQEKEHENEQEKEHENEQEKEHENEQEKESESGKS